MARTFSSNNNLVYPANYNGTAPLTALPLTIACWGRFSATSSQNIVFLTTGDSEYHGMSVGYSTAGRIAAISNAGTEGVAQTSTGITTNTWHHCCAVIASATSRTAYIDGGSSGSNSTSAAAASMVNMSIGAYRRPTGEQFGPAAGQIAEVGLWNVALTASEIAALARGIPPYRVRPASLAGYWPLYGLSSPEPDWKPGILTATRYPMTLVGTPPQYAGHAPRVVGLRGIGPPLIEEAAAGSSSEVFGAAGIFGGRITR